MYAAASIRAMTGGARQAVPTDLIHPLEIAHPASNNVVTPPSNAMNIADFMFIVSHLPQAWVDLE